MNNDQTTQDAAVKAIADQINAKLTPALENIEKTIDEKVDAKLKEINFVRSEFPGQSGDSTMDVKVRTAQFIKALYLKDQKVLSEMCTKAGMAEGTDSAGGYLVPDDVATFLDRIIGSYGLARKLCRIIPMNREILNIPNLATAATVSWPGEATAGTDGSPVLGNTALTAKTMVGLSFITKELLQDANVSVVDMIVELFAEAIAKEEDKQLLTGTGSPFTGVLSNASVNVVTMSSGSSTFGSVTAAYLRDLISQIGETALPGSVFVMHPSVFGTVQKLTENSISIVSAATPIVSGTVEGGLVVPAGTIWGYPVYLNSNMPSSTAVSTKYIAFGNFRYAYFGNRQAMTMDTNDSAVVGSDNAWSSNRTGVRVTERVGIALGVPTAFAVLKTAAS